MDKAVGSIVLIYKDVKGKEQIYSVGYDRLCDLSYVDIETGSGLLLGVHGSHGNPDKGKGSPVLSLAFLFSRPIAMMYRLLYIEGKLSCPVLCSEADWHSRLCLYLYLFNSQRPPTCEKSQLSPWTRSFCPRPQMMGQR